MNILKTLFSDTYDTVQDGCWLGAGDAGGGEPKGARFKPPKTTAK